METASEDEGAKIACRRGRVNNFITSDGLNTELIPDNLESEFKILNHHTRKIVRCRVADIFIQTTDRSQQSIIDALGNRANYYY